MRKKILVIIILVFIFLIIGYFSFNLISDNRKTKLEEIRQKRYEEIRNDIDQEVKRYIYVIAPKCQKGDNGYIITHRTLVYNGGMDKEKFLDVDNKSYCKTSISTECVEDGKWDWEVMISCKDYEDDGYVNWDKGFDEK